MLQALEQAWLGRGICAPNPSVGAILVCNNKIVAKAYHLGPGTAHAEQKILLKMDYHLSDLILYVTLEPCNHWGKTQPCTDLIIKYGIKHVIFAFYDPNPIVQQNNTTQLLQQHGIEVSYFPLPAVDKFYTSYQHWINKRRSWITAKIAQSMDGKIALINGTRHQLSNLECKAFTHIQRLHTDIILTTAKTILSDNPRLDVRIAGKYYKKNLAVLDRTQRLGGKEQVFDHAHQVHVFYSNNFCKTPYVKPNCTFHPIAEYNAALDLIEIVKCLTALGYHDIFVAARGELFWALHALHLVNTTYIYLTAKLLGKTAPCAYHDDDFFKDYHTIQWHAAADNMIMQIDWG